MLRIIDGQGETITLSAGQKLTLCIAQSPLYKQRGQIHAYIQPLFIHDESQSLQLVGSCNKENEQTIKKENKTRIFNNVYLTKLKYQKPQI